MKAERCDSVAVYKTVVAMEDYIWKKGKSFHLWSKRWKLSFLLYFCIFVLLLLVVWKIRLFSLFLSFLISVFLSHSYSVLCSCMTLSFYLFLSFSHTCTHTHKTYFYLYIFLTLSIYLTHSLTHTHSLSLPLSDTTFFLVIVCTITPTRVTSDRREWSS